MGNGWGDKKCAEIILHRTRSRHRPLYGTEARRRELCIEHRRALSGGLASPNPLGNNHAKQDQAHKYEDVLPMAVALQVRRLAFAKLGPFGRNFALGYWMGQPLLHNGGSTGRWQTWCHFYRLQILPASSDNLNIEFRLAMGHIRRFTLPASSSGGNWHNNGTLAIIS
jgi:hypothetical protein